MSETIKIHETYGIYNLASKQYLEELIAKIKLPQLNSLTVDLTNCILDYASTSILIDEILFHLDKLEGQKKLTIIADNFLEFEHLCADLFFGSKFIEISDSFKLNVTEWNQILEELNEKKNIEIIIERNASA